jgi:hypothetical protein
VPFRFHITDEHPLTALVAHGDWSSSILLADGFWSAADYRAHWGFTSYGLLDYWRTKFMILEARETGSPLPCRAFRVSRIGDSFHFHDVLIAAPCQIGGYGGESLIQWLNHPRTPYLVTEGEVIRPDRIPEFIISHAEFEEWHYGSAMPDDHLPVDELTTCSDCA